MKTFTGWEDTSTEASTVLSQPPDSSKLGSNFWCEKTQMSSEVHFAKCMQKSHTHRLVCTRARLWLLIGGSLVSELSGWLVRHASIHAVTTIHFNISPLWLGGENELAVSWNSSLLQQLFDKIIFLSGTAWCVVAFISLAMLFSCADSYVVEKGSACPRGQGYITVFLCDICAIRSSVSRSACLSELCASHPDVPSTLELKSWKCLQGYLSGVISADIPLHWVTGCSVTWDPVLSDIAAASSCVSLHLQWCAQAGWERCHLLQSS